MRNPSKPLLISIVGPTAVGKTELSIRLAQWLKTEIISADSRQFYQEMSIGTAKPSATELSMAPHHFINSHSIKMLYSAGEFGRDAINKIGELHQKHSAVLAVGGSGLYLKAIWEGFDEMPEIQPGIRAQLNHDLEQGKLAELLEELKQSDPEYFNEVDQHNGQRIVRALEVIRSTGQPFSYFRKRVVNELPYDNLKIGLNLDRDVLFDRINRRMDQMLDEGLMEEARALYEFRNHNALKTVGYSEIYGFLDGEYDEEEAVRLLKRNSRRYAKRQLTWFRKYDDIHWFEPQQEKLIQNLIEKTLSE